jgi:hypothetical protein
MRYQGIEARRLADRMTIETTTVGTVGEMAARTWWTAPKTPATVPTQTRTNGHA